MYKQVKVVRNDDKTNIFLHSNMAAPRSLMISMFPPKLDGGGTTHTTFRIHNNYNEILYVVNYASDNISNQEINYIEITS
jgi:hypothetical protein